MTAENRTTIQARIEGVSERQIATMNRLRDLGIPEEMIQRAAKATEEVYEAAELAIVTWTREQHEMSEEDAVLVLNGKKQP